jgi:hypothetical protein
LCFKNNKKFISNKWLKELDAIAIAYWFMDDGSSSFDIKNDKISNYKVKTKKTKEKSYSEEDMKNAIEETVLQCNKKMQEFYGLLEIDVDYIFEQFKKK